MLFEVDSTLNLIVNTQSKELDVYNTIISNVIKIQIVVGKVSAPEVASIVIITIFRLR